MRLMGSRTYYRPPKMPPGLVELMEGLTKEVLRHNPSDVYEFCAKHVQQLLEKRDGPSNKKPVSLEDKILRAQEKVRQRAEKRKQDFDKNVLQQGGSSNTPGYELSESINSPNSNLPQVHPLDIPENINSDSIKDNTGIFVQEQVLQHNTPQVRVPCEIELERSSEVEICQELDSEVFTQESNVHNTNLNENFKNAELITTSNNINGEKIECSVSLISTAVSDTNQIDVDENNMEIIDRQASIEVLADDASTKENKTEFEVDMNINSYDTNSDFEKDKNKVENSTLMIADTSTVLKVGEENVLCVENTDIEKFIDNSEIHNTVNRPIEIADEQDGKIDVQVEKNIEESADKAAEMTNIGADNDKTVNFNNSKMHDIDYNNMGTPSQVEKLLRTDNVEDINDHNANIVDSSSNTLLPKKENEMEIPDVTLNCDTNLNDDDTSINIKSIKDENVNIGEYLSETKLHIPLNTPDTPHHNIKPADSDIPLALMSDKSMNEEWPDIDLSKTPEVADEIPLGSTDEVDNSHVNTDMLTSAINIHVPNQETTTKSNSMDLFVNSSGIPTDSSDTDNCDNSDIDTLGNKSEDSQLKDHTNNMDLETAAITIQKVFRTFLFKSRGSTFEDSANDKSIFLDEDVNNKAESDFTIGSDLNLDRRAHGINRMDTVLQTVNEEKSLSLSTDDSSTLSSAATIIQAHVRGFLVRNKLNSNKTISTNSFAASNSNDPSVTSTDVENDENKNKTILNIHIVPESGDYLSRDESLVTSMDMSMDSPPSTNLHLSSNDNIERRRRLKREDAIQSVSPPSNNSGKLSEDIDSVKENIVHDIVKNHLVNDSKDNNDDLTKQPAKDISNEDQLIVNGNINEGVADNVPSNTDDLRGCTEHEKINLTKTNFDEKDVVTPVKVTESGLIHSGEFHDAVMPTKVSRSDTSVVSEFKSVLVYFLLWNHS